MRILTSWLSVSVCPGEMRRTGHERCHVNWGQTSSSAGSLQTLQESDEWCHTVFDEFYLFVTTLVCHEVRSSLPSLLGTCVMMSRPQRPVSHWPTCQARLWTNQRPVLMSCDPYWPIRGQGCEASDQSQLRTQRSASGAVAMRRQSWDLGGLAWALRPSNNTQRTRARAATATFIIY